MDDHRFSAPIVPIGPSNTDIQIDHASASMVSILNETFLLFCTTASQIDQFMLGHGFTSEVAQNKSMAATFDHALGTDSPKSQHIPLSTSMTNMSNSAENSLGKKVVLSLLTEKSYVHHCPSILDINP
jgi:hypothetical protein